MEIFEAYASVYDFDVALEEGGGSELPANESAQQSYDDTKKLQDAAVKRNKLALANMMIAFTKKVLMLLVKRSKSEYWPICLAHKLVSAQKEKHQTKDTISRVEMTENLNYVSMKELDGPQELFNQLIETRDKYNGNYDGIKVNKDELIAVALSVSTENYQGVMDTEQIQKSDAITLESLRTTMKTLFRTTKSKYESEENGVGEVGLAWFKGKYHNYGEPDHFKSECPNKGRDKNFRRSGNGNGGGTRYIFKRNCNNCGK